jgi:sugar/nucleoside kinase (ribokinase family)
MDKAVIKQLLLNNIQGNIGVLGDFCVDAYWSIQREPGELSLETNILTTPIEWARYAPGGAGNIVENLTGLQVKNTTCLGVVGNDPFGLWLKQKLNASNLIEITRPSYHTPVYCKPLKNDIEQSRIDLGNTPLTKDETYLLLDKIATILPQLKVLIINEQLTNGIHSPLFREEFAKLIDQYHHKVRFIFDGRNNLDSYKNVTLKINAHAASMLAFGDTKHLPQESGLAIMEARNEELVITDGENGSLVFQLDGTVTCIDAIKYHGPIDTVGAGDSFTAGFAYALASNATIIEAAMLGTCCSSVTIRKLNQTGSPSYEEIMAIL